MSSTIAPHLACAMNSRKPAKTMPELTQIAPPDLTIPRKTLRFRVIRPPGEFFLRVAIHLHRDRDVLALGQGSVPSRDAPAWCAAGRSIRPNRAEQD